MPPPTCTLCVPCVNGYILPDPHPCCFCVYCCGVTREQRALNSVACMNAGSWFFCCPCMSYWDCIHARREHELKLAQIKANCSRGPAADMVRT